MLRQLCILFLLTLLIVPASRARAETRLALVIEQTGYGNGLSPIALARSEADLIETTLNETGFAVTRHRDLKKNDLADALDNFRSRLEGAGPSAIGFVYYTGHGSQHPKSQDSYLLGVDARLKSASDLAVYGIDMQSQLDGFAKTGAKAVFLIFDACRNVPAVPGWKSGTKGLARVDAKADMLIAFSTSLNDLAQEGVYAPILAEEIRRAGQTAESAFAAAQRRVAEATGRKQLPWTNNLLYNTVCFAGCTPAEPTAADRPTIVSSLQPAPATLPLSASGHFAITFRDQFLSDRGQGPEMVVLPRGSFQMGSPESESGRNTDEGPQRTVRIDYELAVGKYEVTWAEWDACVADGECDNEAVNNAGGDNGWGRSSRPSVHVNWHDAKTFTSWLSRKTGKMYRLLSEAEWEYAARAGKSARWSFGDDESSLGDFGWYAPNADSRSQPVGAKRANGFGLNDMHGNVWEWVEDCYLSGYSVQASDGSAYSPIRCSSRLARGGAWNNASGRLRSASRNWLTPDVRDHRLGFRVARALP